MDSPFESRDLSRYRNDEPLIRETAEQVIKDFHLFEMEINFSGEYGTPYDELYAQAQPLILRMLLEDTGKLYALMYQIDVPDTWWARIREESEPSAVAHRITDAILQRELLKVLTRNYFRQGRVKGPDLNF
jgi:hypothetical protein